VCKSWLSLISDSQFAKSHFDLAAAPTHPLLQSCEGANSLDIEAPFDNDSTKATVKIYVAIGTTHQPMTTC